VKRKLIEVALPLEAINRESAREKSIRHGHPSTLHLWWARRPLAACRAVLFAQLVDDPSAHPDRFPTEEDQALERKRLFDLLERLVVWENAGDERLLREAHAEIAKCFDGKPPAVLDPFAGGGSIPLEAQRLGLEAHASDLNPVAVLINKALIEIPPRWAGQPPVFPGAADARLGGWPRAAGLAEDIRRYGGWMLDEAANLIGEHYRLAEDGHAARTPVAWLWARTIDCVNPACGVKTPLVSSFRVRDSKKGAVWANPTYDGTGKLSLGLAPTPNSVATQGVKRGQGANFVCARCGSSLHPNYVHQQIDQGLSGRVQLAAVVAAGRSKAYVDGEARDDGDAAVAHSLPRDFILPDEPTRGTFGGNAQGRRYGFAEFSDYFLPRQALAMATFANLATVVRDRVLDDARETRTDAGDYATAVSTYLCFAVSRAADYWSSTATWVAKGEFVRNTFSRQGIAMSWDFVEVNPFSGQTGSWGSATEWVARAVERVPARAPAGEAQQADARTRSYAGKVICTDPPYYDNISYADLADYFYVWLRRSLRDQYPELFATALTPKVEELIASTYRHEGSKSKAEAFFSAGFQQAFLRMSSEMGELAPLTVFYAFKQAESDVAGTASTGWETMLTGLIDAGLTVTSTWPMRTERSGRSVGIGTNALASSIVLTCRLRSASAADTTRRGYLAALKQELPSALREMQQGSLAPVDLAQAAIGPGMSVFSRYRSVVEADGSRMTVRMALALINQVLDEALSEQEGDFSADTRFCVKWFSQFGWDEQLYGVAESLSKAVATSVDGLCRAGIFWARGGRARLVALNELSVNWEPHTSLRLSEWEVVMRLAKALDEQGVDEAARLMALAGERVDLDTAKELAYLLYSVCEKKGWTSSAALFNGLGTSWADLAAGGRSALIPPGGQGELGFSDDEEA
jgi:putative DNA methylase